MKLSTNVNCMTLYFVAFYANNYVGLHYYSNVTVLSEIGILIIYRPGMLISIMIIIIKYETDYSDAVTT